MLAALRTDLLETRDEMREDIRDIKNGQQKVVWWLAGTLSSFVVGGVLGWVFQK